ncbi:hypothetical protein AGABI2DRAFT_189278, partial [Agaricus bisporus var. bisporus H97]|uniref:hypothetical protein n=1 Tax=Agaricus bisporus var. bisporus (strain H97 / ATCC MYA-4626 / FGSC 10389) TaxID=936046 RepID=UPI00029F6E38
MKRPLKTNITVVMVDPDEIDRISLLEVKAKESVQARGAPTWHGLVELPGASKPVPALPNTPWIGPLARESVGVRNIHPYKSGSDTDDYWDNVLGIPKREPVIPSPVDDWDSDDSDLSFSPVIPHHSSSDAPNHHTPVYPDSNPLSPQGNMYGQQAPVIPPSSYIYASPNNSNRSHFSPMTMHGTPVYGSGYMQPLQLVPSPAASMTSLPHTGFTPGYIPQMMTSPVGSMNAGHEQAYLHGMNSPYSPSTIRSLLGSPYVPAWISPQPNTLSLTPTP